MNTLTCVCTTYHHRRGRHRSLARAGQCVTVWVSVCVFIIHACSVTVGFVVTLTCSKTKGDPHFCNFCRISFFVSDGTTNVLHRHSCSASPLFWLFNRLVMRSNYLPDELNTTVWLTRIACPHSVSTLTLMTTQQFWNISLFAQPVSSSPLLLFHGWLSFTWDAPDSTAYWRKMFEDFNSKHFHLETQCSSITFDRLYIRRKSKGACSDTQLNLLSCKHFGTEK